MGHVTQVLAVANQKGGVAKTTTVASLGAAMVEKGKRVLLVDLDPQGSLTFSLGHDPDKLGRLILLEDGLSDQRPAAERVLGRELDGVHLEPDPALPPADPGPARRFAPRGAWSRSAPSA